MAATEMVPPPGDFCSYGPVSHQPGYGIVAKRASKAVAKRTRRPVERLSPMEELSDQYRIAMTDTLFKVEGDEILDLDHKLTVLRSFNENFQEVVRRLRGRAEEQALVKSKDWRSLTETSEQLRAVLDHPIWFVV